MLRLIPNAMTSPSALTVAMSSPSSEAPPPSTETTSSTTMEPSATEVDIAHTRHIPHNSLDPQQLTTVIYIGLAFFFVLCVGTVSAIYMRTVKEKRRNQAAIRGLLDIMTGGGDAASMASANSAYDTHSVCTTTTSVNGGMPLPQTDPAVLARNIENRRQSRLLLTPMQEISTNGDVVNFCLPAPHLSNPVLPPIKRPRGRREDDDENGLMYSIPRPRPANNGNMENGSSVSSIADISRNLALMQQQGQRRLSRSAASFPGTGEVPPSSPPKYEAVCTSKDEDRL